MASKDYSDIGSPVSPEGSKSVAGKQDNKYSDIGEVVAPHETGWFERHPLITKGLEGAGTSAGISALGKGAMLAAPFTGPAAPFVEGAGALLSAAPLANAALGALGSVGGAAIRKYGKGLPGNEALATGTELATPFIGSGLARRVAGGAVGYLSREAEELAPLARKLGFNIETGMARESGKKAASLEAAKVNRDVANDLVSAKTGYPTKSITKAYINDVLSDDKLGGEFAKVYSKENVFSFEPKNFETLTNRLLEEAASGDKTLSPRVHKLAVDLVGGEGNFERLKVAKQYAQNNPAIQKQIVDKVMAQMGPKKITGDVLQRIRSSFNTIAYKSTDGLERHAAGEIVDLIDNAVKADNPKIAEKLAELRPKYRAAKTLQELHAKGHIPEGNVSLEALGKHVAGENNHPYEELGRIGQTFGMKSIGELPESKGLFQSLKGVPGAIFSPVVNGRLGQGIQGALTPTLRRPGVFPYAGTAAEGIADALSPNDSEQ